MDLSGLNIRDAASGGAEFELMHPGTGDPLGVFLTVRGYDSAEVETATRDVSRDAMKGKKTDVAEFSRKRRVAMAQAALIDVRGGTGDTATAQAVRELMAQPGFVWVIEQTEAFAGDRASFFKSAEKP